MSAKEVDREDERLYSSFMKIVLDEKSEETVEQFEGITTNFTHKNLCELNKKCLGLRMLRSWNSELSSPYLEFCCDDNSVLRRGSISTYPLALAHITHSMSILTMELDNSPLKNSYISLGLCLSDFCTDGAYSIGEISQSWGLRDKRNNLQPAEIFQNGSKCGECPSLKRKDRITLYLDLVESTFEIYINEQLIYQFNGLCKDLDYYFGTTLSEDQSITIIENDIIEKRLKDQIQSREESELKDTIHLCVCATCGAREDLIRCPICRVEIRDKINEELLQDQPW
eukprot:gene3022-5921_t